MTSLSSSATKKRLKRLFTGRASVAPKRICTTSLIGGIKMGVKK